MCRHGGVEYAAQFIYGRKPTEEEQACDPGMVWRCWVGVWGGGVVTALTQIICTSLYAVGKDEALYIAVDNVYSVLGDDAPYTEDEVVAALQAFELDQEKAIAHLLSQKATTNGM